MSRLVILICTLLLATTAVPASAQPSPSQTPEWTVTDQLEVDVDGTPYLISSDGQWLAGTGPDNNFCVWSIPDLDESCAGADLRILLESIAWAPDSSAVAFSEDATRLLIDSDIRIFDIESESLINLTDVPGETSGDLLVPADEDVDTQVDIMPSWSANSKTLFFVRGTVPAEENSSSTTIMAIDVPSMVIDDFFVVSSSRWLTVFWPMYVLADGSLLITISHIYPENEQNGVWRIDAAGKRIDFLINFVPEETGLYPSVTDASDDGSLAIVTYPGGFDSVQDTFATYALLDLISGETRALPGSDSETDSSTIAGYPQFVSTSTEIAYPSLDPESDEATINLDPDDPNILIDDLARDQILVGIQWSESNLLLVRGTKGSAIIYTMESESADATPAPPCSCTPPEGN